MNLFAKLEMGVAAAAIVASALLGACVGPVSVDAPLLAQLTDGGAKSVAQSASSTGDDAKQAPSEEPQGPSAACGGCHRQIYEQWSTSMHAFALRSPLMIAQTNIDMGHALAGESAEVKGLCVNCHGPVAALNGPSPTLPLAGGPAANEGVSCVACHGIDDASAPGTGGLREAFGQRVQTATMFGPLADPVASGAHKSQRSALYDDPARICGACHDVNYDRDRDGRIVKGNDLVLQTTFDEYVDYRAAGGDQTCTGCHMPKVAGITRVAEATLGPARELHDHSFVGVDVRLGATDHQAQKREALLRSAAAISFESAQVSAAGARFTIEIENRSGHNFPTGFAFARQAWLEVEVLTQAGTSVFRSGFVAKNGDDLCERETLAGALAPHLAGCLGGADDSLVLLQLKLVDRVVADGVDALGRPKLGEQVGAREVIEQFVRGGPVARRRASDKKVMAPLDPHERRTFTYDVPLDGGPFVPGTLRLVARLRFRSLPPYFLRAMEAQATSTTGAANVIQYVEQLPIVDVARVETTF